MADHENGYGLDSSAMIELYSVKIYNAGAMFNAVRANNH